MTGFSDEPSETAKRALADVTYKPFWLDHERSEEGLTSLVGHADADLVVIGGGFSGLWTALLAKEAEPARDVVLLEASTVGAAASGRNGGFCSSSLTHGLANGLSRWPGEMGQLVSLGEENLNGIEDAVARYGIDCAFSRVDSLDVATESYQVAEQVAFVKRAEAFGSFELLGAEQAQARVHSPTYRGAICESKGLALVDPGRLADGLLRACVALGVRVHEHTPATRLGRTHGGVAVETPYGRLSARRCALGTSAFQPLLRRYRSYVVPVYDYVLMTEPLDRSQLEATRWSGREGVSDSGNQFHYYRMTDDNRILWGGYDAVYYPGKGIGPQFESRPESFARIAGHFLSTFPQLEGLRFSHAWGGAIDTCSRFCPFWGMGLGGRACLAAGYTGLGVGASRFGAQVMLDLLDGRDTQRTRLEMVRSLPIPFPPEPLKTATIALTRWSLARADSRGGSRNMWLRTLDRIGAGFDS
ncbi:MAG: NAD(P)/FAD-dependent oxidoreductase [Acidimicrobiales bacterium]